MQYMFCWSERRPADVSEVLGPVLIMLMAAAISFPYQSTSLFHFTNIHYCFVNKQTFFCLIYKMMKMLVFSKSYIDFNMP